MISRERIDEICRRIAETFHPERIVLFGSYAYGEPTEDSDLDLLVVMPLEESPALKAAEIRIQLSIFEPTDLLVRTPEFVGQRLSLGDSFMRDIFERGRVMYETAHA